jgi:hypothetical protein
MWSISSAPNAWRKFASTFFDAKEHIHLTQKNIFILHKRNMAFSLQKEYLEQLTVYSVFQKEKKYLQYGLCILLFTIL